MKPLIKPIGIICEGCYFGEIGISEVYRPIHATSKLCQKYEHLSIFCKVKYNYVNSLKRTCENFRPKAHTKTKFGKKIYEQKSLGDY